MTLAALAALGFLCLLIGFLIDLGSILLLFFFFNQTFFLSFTPPFFVLGWLLVALLLRLFCVFRHLVSHLFPRIPLLPNRGMICCFCGILVNHIVLAKLSPAFPSIDWSSTWSSLFFMPLDCQVSDLGWRIAHGVLYTVDRLVSFGYDIPLPCFCGFFF